MDTCFPLILISTSERAYIHEISNEEINWLEIFPSMEANPPFIPPPFIINGAVPFSVEEKT